MVERHRHGRRVHYAKVRGERAVRRRRPRPERGRERWIPRVVVVVRPRRRRGGAVVRGQPRRGRLVRRRDRVIRRHDARTVGRMVVDERAFARLPGQAQRARARVPVHAIHARSAALAPVGARKQHARGSFENRFKSDDDKLLSCGDNDSFCEISYILYILDLISHTISV